MTSESKFKFDFWWGFLFCFFDDFKHISTKSFKRTLLVSVLKPELWTSSCNKNKQKEPYFAEMFVQTKGESEFVTTTLWFSFNFGTFEQKNKTKVV